MNECTQLLSADGRGMDGGWGWLVVLGAGLMHFLLVGTARSLGIIYVVLRERFHSSATETAIVAAVFNTTRSLSGTCQRLTTGTERNRTVSPILNFLTHEFIYKYIINIKLLFPMSAITRPMTISWHYRLESPLAFRF